MKYLDYLHCFFSVNLKNFIRVQELFESKNTVLNLENLSQKPEKFFTVWVAKIHFQPGCKSLPVFFHSCTNVRYRPRFFDQDGHQTTYAICIHRK